MTDAPSPPPARPAGALARRALLAVLVALAVGVLLASWTGPAPQTQPVADADAPPAVGGPPAPADAAASAPAEPPSAAPQEPADHPADAPPVTLAFAGDVYADGDAAGALRAGLRSTEDVLSAADVAVVNVEAAVTARGTPAPKQFVFRTSPGLLAALVEAGVDVVALANNHALDYGQLGLADTLWAAGKLDLGTVGAGADEDAAFAPWTTTVHGQRIAVIGATQVLDSSLAEAWTAGEDHPGLASAKDTARLLEAVADARQDADTVVVYLHWGQEKNPCPLPRQQSLAADLVAAGADVVVGTHAHVLLGGGYLGDAYVDYGLGNFAFPARSDEARRTGVLTVTVEGRAVTGTSWTPARIRDGMPERLTGEAARAAVADKERRRDCTGLTAAPRP